MASLPNFELIPDKVYKKMYHAVDWRKRDCYGKVLKKQIDFELEAAEVEKAARFIFGQLTQGGKNWAVSETEFYFFVAHLLHTKLSASIQPYLRLLSENRIMNNC